MKAITCPHCGNLIKKYFAAPVIEDCNHCAAKVMTDEKFSASEPFDVEINKFRVPARVVIPRPPIQPIFLAIGFIGIFLFFMLVFALFAG